MHNFNIHVHIMSIIAHNSLIAFFLFPVHGLPEMLWGNVIYDYLAMFLKTPPQKKTQPRLPALSEPLGFPYTGFKTAGKPTASAAGSTSASQRIS